MIKNLHKIGARCLFDTKAGRITGEVVANQFFYGHVNTIVKKDDETLVSVTRPLSRPIPSTEIGKFEHPPEYEDDLAELDYPDQQPPEVTDGDIIKMSRAEYEAMENAIKQGVIDPKESLFMGSPIEHVYTPLDSIRQKLYGLDLSGLNICITGLFKGFTRNQLANALRERRATIVHSVTEKTNVLISGNLIGGGKERRAQGLGINIIYEAGLDELGKHLLEIKTRIDDLVELEPDETGSQIKRKTFVLYCNDLEAMDYDEAKALVEERGGFLNKMFCPAMDYYVVPDTLEVESDFSCQTLVRYDAEVRETFSNRSNTTILREREFLEMIWGK